jgi:hypothetical protein
MELYLNAALAMLHNHSLTTVFVLSDDSHTEARFKDQLRTRYTNDVTSTRSWVGKRSAHRSGKDIGVRGKSLVRGDSRVGGGKGEGEEKLEEDQPPSATLRVLGLADVLRAGRRLLVDPTTRAAFLATLDISASLLEDLSTLSLVDFSTIELPLLQKVKNVSEDRRNG